MRVSDALTERDWDDLVGVALFVAFEGVIEVFGYVPVMNILVQFALLATSFGAVLLTFFGLCAFEPARIREVG